MLLGWESHYLRGKNGDIPQKLQNTARMSSYLPFLPTFDIFKTNHIIKLFLSKYVAYQVFSKSNYVLQEFHSSKVS